MRLAGLQKVQARVEKGRLKRAEKIGAAVEARHATAPRSPLL